MTGGAWWIGAGQIGPGTARAQDVQHSIEHLPRIRPGTPTSIGTWRRGSKVGFQRGPLGVGQITSRNSHSHSMWLPYLSDVLYADPRPCAALVVSEPVLPGF